jgi:copper chaperone CopZ
MIKQFNVSGVTCMHCVSKVKKALEQHEDVNSAVVTNDNQMVKLDADPMPSVETLNLLLEDFGDYKLSV